MFEQVNVEELEKIVRGVITPEVVTEGNLWHLNDGLRGRIRRAMFGPGRPTGGIANLSATEQRAVTNMFTKKVASPLIDSLPAHTSAWAVLMLYDEFVNAVFIQPEWDGDIGGGD